MPVRVALGLTQLTRILRAATSLEMVVVRSTRARLERLYERMDGSWTREAADAMLTIERVDGVTDEGCWSARIAATSARRQ